MPHTLAHDTRVWLTPVKSPVRQQAAEERGVDLQPARAVQGQVDDARHDGRRRDGRQGRRRPAAMQRTGLLYPPTRLERGLKRGLFAGVVCDHDVGWQ